MFLPEQDRYSTSKRQLESRIATLFGGRVAEELVFGADAVTTGASNDIERATELARNMVTRWGLSDRLGSADLQRGVRARCSSGAASPSTSRCPTSPRTSSMRKCAR